MIFLNGIESIIESTYLNETISTKIGSCNIFVNPKNIKFLARKTVIINIVDYPEEYIQQLLNNECKIISRVKYDIKGINFEPYILKINSNIFWNGDIIEQPEEINDILEDDLCSYDMDRNILRFPKLIDTKDIKDNENNLSCIGWTLQQVGINIVLDTPFINLDIIKTGKIVL